MAELRLDVTLNLAGFRAQLEKLAIEAGARYFGVKLSIDGANFRKQLQLLEKIKPVIKINDDQLYGARKTIGALNKSLATLRKATATPIEIKVKYVEVGKPPSGATEQIANTVSRGVKVSQAIEGFSSGQLRSTRRAIIEAGIKPGDIAKLKQASTDELKKSIVHGFNNSAEEAIKGFVAGLNNGKSDIAFAAGKIGEEGIRGINDALGIDSPSKVFKQIGKFSVDGLEIGFLNGLKSFKSKSIAEVSAIVIALKAEFAKLQGALPAPASLRGGARGGRGYFNSIGPLPEGSKEPYTMTDRGYQPYLGGPGVGPSAAPRGLLPPASAIGRGSLGQSFAGAPVNFRMGADLPALPSSEAAERLRQQDQVAQGTAGRLRQQARVAQAHLRSAERSATVFGERAARLDKAMSAFRTSGRTTGYTSPIGPLPRDSAEPYAAGSRGMFGKEGFEARLESRPVAGLLSPSLTPTREQIVAARTQIARQRSDARALDAQVENQFRQTQFNPTVPPRQYFQPNTQPLLPGGGVAPSRGGSLALRAGRGGGGAPPSGGGGVPPRSGGMPAGGGVPPGGASGFPSTQLGAGYYQVGKALSAVKSSYGQVKEFLNTKALPLTGAITGLAGEFGGAIKQVLLFGTAYKALAFLTSIPGEALDAAKGLATYKNQLKAVTSESQTFDQSLAFVDNLAQRFNAPIESARQGFVKLYASMQPVGFNQVEIENLFTGISKAAAAFGLSSDKVDRVNYAFAQMASKGQIMSEELKGQLGDVLPGALGLFAKAAQMSIPEFTKAMEDGAFQGKAMQQVLGNVAILMNSQYGPAAEGAAKTLQGAINQIQNNLQLMYESFAPVVDTFAAAFGPQINSLIKDVSSTVKVLTGDFGKLAKEGEGFSALSPQAQSLYTTIKTLEPSLRQAGAAVLDLASRFAVLIPAIVQTIATAISFASSPLARAAILGAIAVGTLTAALKLLEITGLKAALKAVYAFISGLLGIPAATGIARIAIIGLKLALTGLLVGAILMGLDFLIGKLLGIGDAAAKSKKEIQELDRELDAMAGAGDLEGTTKVYMEANTNLIKAQRDYEKASKKVRELQTKSPVGSAGGVTHQLMLEDAQKKAEEAYNKITNATRQKQKAQTARDSAQNIKERQNEESLKQEGKLEKIDLSGDDKTKKTNLESYYSLEDQLAKASTQADIDRINAIFEHRKSLINSAYDLEEARANSIQKEAIAHQKAVSSIFLELQKKQIDARLDVLKAQGSVAGGATATGGLTGGATGAGITQYISGDPSRADYQPDHGTIQNYHDHIAFATRELAIAAYEKLTAADIKVTEFQGFGQGVTGPHSGPGSLHHKGLAMDVPGYQHGGSGPIGPKEYAGSARVRAVLGIGGAGSAAAGAGAPRKVPGSEKRDVVAAQAKEIAQQRESLTLTHAQKEAQVALNIAKETYLAQIFGIAEKELQLGQLQKQTALLKAGATDQEIEDEMKLETIKLKHAAGIEQATEAIASYNREKNAGVGDQDAINKGIAYQNSLIEDLNKKLPTSIKLQQRLNKEGREYAFTGRIKALANEIQLLTTVGDAERRLLELRQGGLTPKESQQVYSLEKVKKNLEDTKALIGNFVSSTSSDYKGFLKAVISGEDAVDALQKFQEGLTDKVLTIFLDVAMAPVEGMMKKSLEGLFMPKVNVAEVPITANTTELTKNTEAIAANTSALGSKAVAGGVPIKVQPYDPNKMPDFSKNAFNVSPESAFAGFDTENMFAGLNDQIRAGLNEIPSSFAEATANLQISSEPFKQALITDLPNALTTAGDGVKTQGATFGEGLTNFVGGLGAAAAGVAGIAAGISQIGKGGTSNVLGGIGSILMGAGGAIGGFGKIFGFADGGMVSQPTLGMVGEGKYNEAIVPLPNGRSIPVQFNQESSLRSAMGNNGSNNNPVSPVLNMSFETTRFGNTDYVSREQLEAAMMQTRSEATKAGARRGMTMTLDKLQQSPSTRSRVGLG